MRETAVHSWKKGEFSISTDPSRLDKERMLAELRKSYWAKELPPALIWQSISGSVPFGLFAGDGDQVGFARAVTDGARFAWVSDVYVDAAWQGRGLGLWLMECMLAHPELLTIRRWMLSTDDAFDFYERVGFRRIADSKYMERLHSG